jgi:spermidine synthase
MKDFIYPEMMIHTPLCTNKDPKNILILTQDGKKFENEVKKHIDISSKVIEPTLNAIGKIADKSVDVVVVDAQSDNALLAHINRVLKDDGQVVLNHPSLDNTKENKDLMKTLANYFKIIMPYNVDYSKTALFCSKEYHPTADIILQRSDMLDNLNYYNCDIHIAAFAMPNYIRKEYLGIIKN